jgi:hypothetical protein
MESNYDSSWDDDNEDLFDEKYAEWEERDWEDWLEDNLQFPFMATRKEDMSVRPFSETDANKPFQVGHTMKVVAIEDEDESYGLIMKVREGRKTGYVPLSDLEVTPKKDPNFWYVREYVVWFANR